MEEYTHQELVFLGKKFLRSKESRGRQWSCGVVFTEFKSSSCEIPDVIGFKSARSYLIECKVSRNDFLSDKKKSFRKDPALGMGDFRYYLCPAGLIVKSELPPGWGLIYAFGERKLQRTMKLQVHAEQQPANKHEEWCVMYSALRRLELRGRIKEIYKPLEEFNGTGV